MLNYSCFFLLRMPLICGYGMGVFVGSCGEASEEFYLLHCKCFPLFLCFLWLVNGHLHAKLHFNGFANG